MTSIALPSGANPVEVTLYLASLVSNPQEIDALLDPLRQITSRPGFNEPSPAEAQQLQAICDQLVEHLLTKERVRSFTQADLERRLQDRFGAQGSSHTLHRMLGATLGSTLIAGFLCLRTPPPTGLSERERITFSVLFTIPTMFTIISWGAAWLFFSALQYFTARLRQAYIVIASGVALLGLMHLQMPVLGYTRTFNSGWIYDGAVGLLYMPAHLLLFIGTMIFARAMGIRNRLTSLPVLVLVSAIGAAIVALSPHHTAARWSEAFFDIATGTFPISIMASIAAAINCYLIARKINEIYRSPMRWLGHANVLLAFSVAHILLLRMFFGYDNFWANYGLIMVPYLVASTVFLKAGYSFNKTSRY